MQVTKEILFDYFAGRLTALQRSHIAEWAKDPGHEEWFYQCLDEWERSRLQYPAEVESSLERYRGFLHQVPVEETAPPATAHFTPDNRQWYRWLAAACFVLLSGLGLWLYRDTLLYQVHATAYGETRPLELADGSQVVLNANTSLKVPRFNFGRGNREVYLDGEAKFSVSHTRDHRRFVVHTRKGMDVVVLGTEFSVFSRPRGTRVVLTSGKVQIQYQPGTQPGNQLTMKPGDMVTLHENGQLAVKKVAQPEKHAAWALKQFVFENTSLQEISAMLMETYGVRVEIGDKGLASQTLTGSFSAQSADELLQAVSEILEINMTRKGNRIILTQSKK
jgi:ferric-dicitrate binding protein FerR (iron transport regulator)